MINLRGLSPHFMTDVEDAICCKDCWLWERNHRRDREGRGVGGGGDDDTLSSPVVITSRRSRYMSPTSPTNPTKTPAFYMHPGQESQRLPNTNVSAQTQILSDSQIQSETVTPENSAHGHQIGRAHV